MNWNLSSGIAAAVLACVVFAFTLTIDLVGGVLMKIGHANGTGDGFKEARFVTVSRASVDCIMFTFTYMFADWRAVNLASVVSNEWFTANGTVNGVGDWSAAELS